MGGVGTYSVQVEKDYFSSAGAMGLLFDDDKTSKMYTAGIAWESGSYDLMLQEWTSPNGGTNWIQVGSWNTESIDALTPYLWYTLDLEVTNTEAILTYGTHTLNLALSGAPGDSVGLYNSVGWSSYDNFEADVVPEPSSLALLLSGIGGLAGFGYRKKR